jgi:class 3 adenylate cyclase
MNCPACNSSNPEGMRFCGMCGSPLSPQLTGRERRRVSIVFIDLAGFSSLTQGFDPERLRDLADEILTVIAGIIEDYDGYVDAFRGDGLIALFGAPHSHPDDAQRAVLAAAAGLKAIESIGRSRGYPLLGRAGVNTGVVIAGSVGSGRVKEYTVMGSAVNLAARLEEAATNGEVWVGPETFEATKHVLHYEPSPPLVLRGFPDVTQAYRFIDSIHPHHIDPYAHLAFTGRQRELAELWKLYHQARETQTPQTLWLVGEAGIGKTRLLEEFLKRLADQEPVRIIRLSDLAVPERSSDSWMQLATEIFELAPTEERSLKIEKVLSYLQELFPNAEESWRRTILGSLQLIERRTRPRSDNVSGKHKRRPPIQTAAAWCRLLFNLVQDDHGQQTKVLVVAIDDRTEDKALGALLSQLMKSSQAVLILQTSRWRDLPRGANALPIAPLNLDESLALLKQLANPLLEVATRSLVTQVGGIPAYILELGRALSLTPTGSFSGSLASLLQARLDMLEPSTRQLLAQAALVGERCWSGLLVDMAGSQAQASLETLVQENLLVPEVASSVPGVTEYRFQSELLRTAVLRMVPFSDRPPLHQRIASWLEQHAPLSLSTLIGYHFEQAGYQEAAYPHYLAGADLAVSNEDFGQAFRLYEHLLGLNLEPELLVQGGLAYAQAALSSGDKERAAAQLTVVEAWLEQSDGESVQAFRRIHAQLNQEALRSRDALGPA